MLRMMRSKAFFSLGLLDLFEFLLGADISADRPGSLFLPGGGNLLPLEGQPFCNAGIGLNKVEPFLAKAQWLPLGDLKR